MSTLTSVFQFVIMVTLKMVFISSNSNIAGVVNSVLKNMNSYNDFVHSKGKKILNKRNLLHT